MSLADYVNLRASMPATWMLTERATSVRHLVFFWVVVVTNNMRMRIRPCGDKDKMASLFKSVFGSAAPENEPSGADMVQKMCGRVTSATLIEDRRDALRAIKAMSRKFRQEVGEQCLEVLFDTIRENRTDGESVGYALEAILNVIALEEGEESTDELLLGAKFAGVVTRNPENINLLLCLIEEFEFQIRRPTIRLLTAFLSHKLSEVQECILKLPMGISRIMDLLADTREVIRNDALLLILQLTRSNSQIQKIVAFENAFERVLGIIQEEGLSDGGIVVEDCIRIMQNLLRGNTSNQSFFREASQVQALVPFFDFQLSTSTSWPSQKVLNITQMLKLVRTLVSWSNTSQNTSQCQKLMHQCHLLSLLCSFMFAGGVPTEILIETINTVADVIRGNFTNQQFFDTVQTSSQPPRSGVLTILMCMVNEKQPLTLRLAALYCFQSYLYKNEVGQGKVINTLLPSSAETTVSAGQVLCAGLFGPEFLSNWMTSTALASSLNPSLKPQLLRVQLSMQGRGQDKGQVTLLQQCSSFLAETPDLKPQSHIGLLVLLCTWLNNCPMAVAQFLSTSTNVSFLISMIEQHHEGELEKIVGGLCATLVGICLAYNDGSSTDYPPETVRQIIVHRIGQETFAQSLSLISNSEYFTQAAKHPQVTVTNPSQLCFDHAFTTLFKQLSDALPNSIDPSYSMLNNSSASPGRSLNPSQHKNETNFEEHTSVVQQYKELLREQEEEVNRLKQRCEVLEKARQGDQEILKQQQSKIQTLTAASNLGVAAAEGGDLMQLRDANLSLERVQESLKQEVATKEVHLQRLQGELEAVNRSRNEQNASLTAQLKQVKEERDQLQADYEALLVEKDTLDQQLQKMQQSQSTPVSQLGSPQVEELQLKLKQLQIAHEELQQNNITLEKEQEDLLVLLADNDSKIKKYKTMLEENKISLPESDDDDEEDDDDEDL